MQRNSSRYKQISQLTFIILLFLVLRVPLLDKALWHDEIYGTYQHLNRFPIFDLPFEFDHFHKDFNRETDYRRIITIHSIMNPYGLISHLRF